MEKQNRSSEHLVKEADESLKLLINLFTPIMLASQEKAMAPAEGCEHRLRLGLNDHEAICCACRKILEGPCSYGIYVTGRTDYPPDLTSMNLDIR